MRETGIIEVRSARDRRAAIHAHNLIEYVPPARE